MEGFILMNRAVGHQYRLISHTLILQCTLFFVLSLAGCSSNDVTPANVNNLINTVGTAITIMTPLATVNPTATGIPSVSPTPSASSEVLDTNHVTPTDSVNTCMHV